MADDPVTATAVEATANATGKALEIIHDTGAYLNRVFDDIPANVVGFIGDWVREQRVRNLDALGRRTAKILAERDVQERIELSPNIASELLIAAQDESRDELMDLWARLLANAMDSNLKNVRHSFIDAVKKMDPQDAILVQYLYRNNHPAVRRGGGQENVNLTTVEQISLGIGTRIDDVEVSLRHLADLGFLDIGHNPGTWHVGAFTRVFMHACYPELNKEE
jgi:Abortive infection alpha